MVKAGMGRSSSEGVAVIVPGALERDDEIEGPSAAETAAHGDDASGPIPRRRAHRAFVGVRWEELERALWILGIAQQRVNRLHGRNPLKVPVSAGVIVGPGDRRRLSIVDLMAGGFGLRVSTVEVIGVAHPSQGTERGAHVLMVPRCEKPSTPTPETFDRGALVRG